jgi:hypothetical protein
MLGYVHVDEVSYVSNLLTNLEDRRMLVKTPLIDRVFSAESLELELNKSVGKTKKLSN